MYLYAYELYKDHGVPIGPHQHQEPLVSIFIVTDAHTQIDIDKYAHIRMKTYKCSSAQVYTNVKLERDSGQYVYSDIDANTQIDIDEYTHIRMKMYECSIACVDAPCFSCTEFHSDGVCSEACVSIYVVACVSVYVVVCCIVCYTVCYAVCVIVLHCVLHYVLHCVLHPASHCASHRMLQCLNKFFDTESFLVCREYFVSRLGVNTPVIQTHFSIAF